MEKRFLSNLVPIARIEDSHKPGIRHRQGRWLTGSLGICTLTRIPKNVSRHSWTSTRRSSQSSTYPAPLCPKLSFITGFGNTCELYAPKLCPISMPVLFHHPGGNRESNEDLRCPEARVILPLETLRPLEKKQFFLFSRRQKTFMLPLI